MLSVGDGDDHTEVSVKDFTCINILPMLNNYINSTKYICSLKINDTFIASMTPPILLFPISLYHQYPSTTPPPFFLSVGSTEISHS